MHGAGVKTLLLDAGLRSLGKSTEQFVVYIMTSIFST